MNPLRIIITILCASLSFTHIAKANVFDIIADNDFVPISVDFTGRTMRIYGATDIKGTIILTIRGSNTKFALHKKTKKYGFWVDSKTADIEQVPAYYNIMTSNHINTNAYTSINQIGIENTQPKITPLTTGQNIEKLWQDTIEVQKRLGRYTYQANGVVKKGQYLFEAIVRLPSDIPTGIYTLSAYVQTKNELVLTTNKGFYVGRDGITKILYTSARDYPFWYAILVILASIGIGIGATYKRRTY